MGRCHYTKEKGDFQTRKEITISQRDQADGSNPKEGRVHTYWPWISGI